jgi:hypothetical protein
MNVWRYATKSSLNAAPTNNLPMRQHLRQTRSKRVWSHPHAIGSSRMRCSCGAWRYGSSRVLSRGDAMPAQERPPKLMEARQFVLSEGASRYARGRDERHLYAGELR